MITLRGRNPNARARSQKGPPAAVIREDVLASVFNVRAHISVSPIDGALLCYPYAAFPAEGEAADAGVTGPAP